MKEDRFFRKKAAAIGYDPSKDNAPRLLAKGTGTIAEKIIEKAREHDIQIKEDKDLVEVLATLDLHEEIPENMYKAVAQLLAEIYRINSKL
ncbi:MAG: EscU/YscU/HrcU family type III secretion system export apparatus switch protein [Deferribacterales bacterium]